MLAKVEMGWSLHFFQLVGGQNGTISNLYMIVIVNINWGSDKGIESFCGI
jgi:hypothetical protein